MEKIRNNRYLVGMILGYLLSLVSCILLIKDVQIVENNQNIINVSIESLVLIMFVFEVLLFNSLPDKLDLKKLFLLKLPLAAVILNAMFILKESHNDYVVSALMLYPIYFQIILLIGLRYFQKKNVKTYLISLVPNIIFFVVDYLVDLSIINKNFQPIEAYQSSDFFTRGQLSVVSFMTIIIVYLAMKEKNPK